MTSQKIYNTERDDVAARLYASLQAILLLNDAEDDGCRFLALPLLMQCESATAAYRAMCKRADRREQRERDEQERQAKLREEIEMQKSYDECVECGGPVDSTETCVECDAEAAAYRSGERDPVYTGVRTVDGKHELSITWHDYEDGSDRQWCVSEFAGMLHVPLRTAQPGKPGALTFHGTKAECQKWVDAYAAQAISDK